MRNVKRGAVFLDRDGVVNASPGEGFVTRTEHFRFLPGVLDALRLLKEQKQIVIVVSNQSVVGRGIISRAQLQFITRQMLKEIRAAGGRVHAVYYCTHHPKENCACRKPKTHLLQRAQKRFSIDLKRSVVIGDDEKDIQMGRSAGCRTILVLTGKQSRAAVRRFSQPPDQIARDLLRAVGWVVQAREAR